MPVPLHVLMNLIEIDYCRLRNLGASRKYYHNEIGWNHRLDPIQALVLLEKLPYVDIWTSKKSEIAKRYTEGLSGLGWLGTPQTASYVDQHGHHLYVLRITDGERESFIRWLADDKIPTIIHYPIPIQKSGGIFLP